MKCFCLLLRFLKLLLPFRHFPFQPKWSLDLKQPNKQRKPYFHYIPVCCFQRVTLLNQKSQLPMLSESLCSFCPAMFSIPWAKINRFNICISSHGFGNVNVSGQKGPCILDLATVSCGNCTWLIQNLAFEQQRVNSGHDIKWRFERIGYSIAKVCLKWCLDREDPNG